jgi:hypothetical protein
MRAYAITGDRKKNAGENEVRIREKAVLEISESAADEEEVGDADCLV